MKCDALHAENAELRAHLVQIAASVANIIKTQDGINVVHANKLDFLGNELQKLSSALLSMSVQEMGESNRRSHEPASNYASPNAKWYQQRGPTPKSPKSPLMDPLDPIDSSSGLN